MAKVVLVCNSDGALAVFRAPLIRALVRAGHEVVTISPRSFYFKELQEAGAHPIEVEFSRHSLSIVSNLRLLCQLWSILRREQPDVAHFFTHKAVIFGSVAASLSGVKTIVATVTGLGTLFMRTDVGTRFLRWALVLQYRLLLPKGTPVLFQNPDDKADMEALGAVSACKPILTNGSGIDLDEFDLPNSSAVARARQELGLEINVEINEQIVVLFPARSVPEKGFREFYGAARDLNIRHPGRYIFCHMGFVDTDASGSLNATEIFEFAESHGVYYLGFKTVPKPLMTAADVVALPSYREGVPRSLIEGLALGKCIVTTDAPGCREAVINGENGFLCQVRDRDGLSDALSRIDREFLVKAGVRSRNLCEEKFDVRKLNTLTLDLYGLSLATEYTQPFRSSEI